MDTDRGQSQTTLVYTGSCLCHAQPRGFADREEFPKMLLLEAIEYQPNNRGRKIEDETERWTEREEKGGNSKVTNEKRNERI